MTTLKRTVNWRQSHGELLLIISIYHQVGQFSNVMYIDNTRSFTRSQTVQSTRRCCIVCLSVRSSVCLSHLSTVYKQRHHHTFFSLLAAHHSNFFSANIATGSLSTGALNAGVVIDLGFFISLGNYSVLIKIIMKATTWWLRTTLKIISAILSFSKSSILERYHLLRIYEYMCRQHIFCFQRDGNH